jgi:hypothetical protein
LGATQSLVLGGERRGFEYVVGKTADVDLAIIVLEDQERQAIRQHYEFSYSTHFASMRPVGGGTFYVVCGYPQSQNKLSPRLMRSNRAVGEYYVTRNRLQAASLKLAGKYDAVHFALGAPPKGAIGMDGRRVTFPLPLGVSGGGVWRLEFGRHPARLPVPRLVGVLIEHHKRPGVFIGTRIRETERMLRDLL